jgi:DNA-binding transcriptional LysR family regulator
LGPEGEQVVATVSAGLGTALAPLTSQPDADELEQRIQLFSRGREEAVEYFAATCRHRKRKPESVKVLLLMLRDLAPSPGDAS